MTAELINAVNIAHRAHEGQVRADGSPFIDHPIAVALAVQRRGRDDLVPAAILHDVLEDTSWTTDDLEDAGISEATIRLVQYLTRVEGETYANYIRRVASSRDASLIKRCDIDHNLETVDDYRPGLRERYERALDVLPEPPKCRLCGSSRGGDCGWCA